MKKLRSKRAVLLEVVMMITAIFLVADLAFLTRGAEDYRAASYASQSLLASELAMAGMESARVRMDKDPSFPPPNGESIYSCTENVYDVDGTTVTGCYVLSIDMTWQFSPYYIARISSVGCVGAPANPTAKRRIQAELDLNPAHTTTPATFFKFVNWQDDGAL